MSIEYQYTTFQDSWGTSPLTLAYLPPHLALAAWNDSPIRINDQPLESWTDLKYITPLGRIAGVAEVNTVAVRLPGIAKYWRMIPNIPYPPASGDPLQARLALEVQKIMDAGHLKPGYGLTGIWDIKANNRLGQSLADNWHNPAETIYTLIRALPLLPSDVQVEVRHYIQNEFQAYPPYAISHAGWVDGVSREAFDLPPEVIADSINFPPCGDCNSWGFPPENHYASWMYAAQFGNANAIFNETQIKLDTSPEYKQSMPYLINSYIAGYIGYLHLAELANAGHQPEVEKLLIDTLILRAALSKYPTALQETGFEYAGYKWSIRTFAPNMDDTLFIVRITGTLWCQMPLYGYPIIGLYGLSGGGTGGGYSFGIDFVNLIPELADFMRDYTLPEIQAAVADYSQRAPFWFVSQTEQHGGEGVEQPLYDVIALFQAKAMILKEKRAELEHFLDIPAVQIGDLYYIQKLILTLEAGT
jgi:hypothetical protein